METPKSDELTVDVDAGIPMECAACGADYLWVIELEDLDGLCPTCRAAGATA